MGRPAPASPPIYRPRAIAAALSDSLQWRRRPRHRKLASLAAEAAQPDRPRARRLAASQSHLDRRALHRSKQCRGEISSNSANETVYSEAVRAIVWPGKGSDKADGTFKLLASMPAFLEEYSSRIPESDDIQELPALDLETLNSVGESPWWTRAWCLQEIVMAKEASLYLGSSSLDWRDVSKAFWEWAIISSKAYL